MKILIVGDIVGSPGRRAFAQIAGRMKHEGRVDAVVVNAENAAGGRGLTPVLAEELFSVGADVITLGDHTWDQKDLHACLDREWPIVRPANFPPGCPGRGLVTLDTDAGRLSVLSLVGRVFMPPMDCPFRAADAALGVGALFGRAVVVDFHAEATSEKIVLGRYLDGRASCVVGTHTHVQTSDETILPGGTAYITDLGMTGPKDSALGRDLSSVTAKMLTGMPTKFGVATEDVVLEGVVVTVDVKTGKASKIRRVRERAD